MRTVTKVIEIYTLNELEESARAVAFEQVLRTYEDQQHDLDYVLDDIFEAANNLGFDISKRKNHTYPYTDVNWSIGGRGSGFSFKGAWGYQEGAVEWCQTNYPKDEVLLSVVTSLEKWSKENPEVRYAVIRPIGWNSLGISIEIFSAADINQEAHDDLFEAVRGFCGWAEQRLTREVEWQESEEYLTDLIDANELEFTKEGKIYHE